MKFGILGSLVVTENDEPRTPTAPKQRQLLALLVLNTNRAVSVAECAEELWDGNAPASAVATVHTYVMGLRKCLAGSGKSLAPTVNPLLTGHQGYLLSIEPGSLDLRVFEELSRNGRSALENDDEHTAAHALRDALALWRGPALADVHPGPVLRARLAGIEELRLSTLEQRIEADLRLGHHHELLCELATLVQQHPLNENLHAQFMVALYRSGRPASALAVYQGLHRALKLDLGLEPSSRVRRLQQALLVSDPALDIVPHACSRLSLDLIGVAAGYSRQSFAMRHRLPGAHGVLG